MGQGHQNRGSEAELAQLFRGENAPASKRRHRLHFQHVGFVGKYAADRRLRPSWVMHSQFQAKTKMKAARRR